MKTLNSLLKYKYVNTVNLVVGLVAIAVFSRLIPHLPNFTAIGAAALLAGATLRPRWVALTVPLVALLVSDLILGFYSGMIFNYAAWALIVLLASGFSERMQSWTGRFSAAFAASVLFFVVSNFGVWLTGGLYPLNAAGLAECYTLALPFSATQIGGDLFFTGLLFAAYDFAMSAVLSKIDSSPSL